MRRRDRGIGRVPNNRTQNKIFNDAARGLTKAQKERLRREVEFDKKRYEDYDYVRIRELAQEIIRKGNEKLQEK